jgi:hypothetical protein
MLKHLIDLLMRIATQKRPVQVEVNYDGRSFRWQIKVSNISADEFSQIGQMQPPQGSV